MALVREEGTHSIRFAIVEGQRVPIYAGAAGKVLLAFGPPELRQEYLDSEKLIPLSPNTITDAKVLAAELKKARERGYAVSRGERGQRFRRHFISGVRTPRPFCGGLGNRRSGQPLYW